MSIIHLGELVNSPGARPASSTTRMPARGGAIASLSILVVVKSTHELIEI